MAALKFSNLMADFAIKIAPHKAAGVIATEGVERIGRMVNQWCVRRFFSVSSHVVAPSVRLTERAVGFVQSPITQLPCQANQPLKIPVANSFPSLALEERPADYRTHLTFSRRLKMTPKGNVASRFTT
jgi:hypothetical protein